jgi:TRAP-type uncharacterized transport system substrate-binding protein
MTGVMQLSMGVAFFKRECAVRCLIRGISVASALVLLASGASAQQPNLRSTLREQANDGGRLSTQAQGRKPKAAKLAPQADGTLLPDRDRLNAATVTIDTAPVGGAVSTMGSDMANVLDDGENLRVLPILGKGSVQNLIDILRLRSVDMGFVMSDALEFVRTEYLVPNIEDRVHYISKMFNIELHIVARKEINTVRDLAGKKIFAERNFGYYSIRNVFNRMNITADIDYKTDIVGGLQKVIDGEADAWVGDIAKVAPLIRNIRNDDKRLHLVSVPFDQKLVDLYLPTSLTSEEYPNLIPPGESVQTVAASILLMVYAWPEGSDRYNRVAKFVNALFSKIGELQRPPRHPKWRETFIDANMPRLHRFKAAEDWLAVNVASQEAGPKRDASVAGKPQPNQTELFNQFREWQRANKR